MSHFIKYLESNNRQGFTLLEVILATILASGILAAIIMFYQPLLTEFNQAFNFQRLRHKVSNPLQALRNELVNAKTVYYDTARCYAFCFPDRVSGNRILYYWTGSDLYRKSETGTQSIACSNGKPFAKGMDKANSAFSVSGNLLTLKLAAMGTNNTSYSAQTTVFPNLSERQTLFYDGFGCNTDSGYGWTLQDTGEAYWKIESSSGASGAYWLRENLRHNQGSAITATAQVNVDLSRAASAYLQFKYRTQGTMDPGEIFTVNFYDGTTWHEVFRDDLLGSISALSTTTVDLSSYTLATNNAIRFDGSLKNTGDHWVIDEIEVLAK